jgi:putative peptide zinc metalloprotease protein
VTGNLSVPPPPGARRSSFSRFVRWEIAAWDPHGFFTRSLALVRPIFGMPALVLGSVAVGLALVVSISNAGDLGLGLGALSAEASLLAIWLLYAGVVLVHELAHGYTCTYFGGRPRELGFLLLYGKPCVYCDVTDAWLLRKSQRLWVMAAGSLVEIGIWAVATLVWRITAPETWTHRGALVLLTITGLGTLFNFNPLIQFDGYYMLSDGLEIPNLRQRAFADLRARLLGRPRPPGTARERRIFAAYGLVAVLYSVLLIGAFVVLGQRWVAERWGVAGVALLWGAVVVVSTKPLVAAAHEIAAALRERSRVRRLTLAVLVLVAGGVLAFLPWPLKIATEAQVQPRSHVVLRSPLAGAIESVHAAEGDLVRAGQPVLQLATRDLDFELAKARAERSELEERLALLEKGPRREEVELAERRVDEAATRVKFTRVEHERALAGVASDVVPQQTADAAERELRLAEEQEQAMRKTLELLQAGSRPEEIGAMRARLDAVRAHVAQLDDERSRTRILATISGQVLTPHAERLVGRYVERGDSLLQLADLATMQLEIPVPEKEVADVQLGASVHFKSRGLPGRTYAGSVVAIAPAAEAGRRQRTVLVTSELDNRDATLRAGTTGFAKIYCGERHLGSILWRRVVRSLRTEFWSLW